MKIHLRNLNCLNSKAKAGFSIFLALLLYSCGGAPPTASEIQGVYEGTFDLDGIEGKAVMLVLENNTDSSVAGGKLTFTAGGSPFEWILGFKLEDDEWTCTNLGDQSEYDIEFSGKRVTIEAGNFDFDLDRQD